MIPKIIHYCWFGHNKMPKSSKKYIEGWKKLCPDYKVIKWSEDNFDINSHLFTKIEYNKQNWAFVSDYVRLYALYTMGGIYLDTDVEMIKSLTPLLKNKSFTGLQDWDSINSGLIYGANAKDLNIKNIINIYNNFSYNTMLNLDPITHNTVTIITNYFRKLGFKYKDSIQHINGCTIYPTDYFSPQKFGYKNADITNNTYTIHRYFGSWTKGSLTKKKRRHIKEGRLIRRIIGRYLFVHLYNIYYIIKNR